ncbi:hypothetical protein M5X00_15195 [Paenibacillus alvei]|uniref:Uncharacterized protein n=1 Tax=Paenibacillus alvei TaxID=44250 RepID=A0ABT4H4C5_PAEAL|nr:hypothetical protein [Paenibacillus alvei]MCY7487181.1 hypothetical protein [Paenibacillus alvei]MCY9539324.1 hypothetical protein [Paenibacillus alvei]MCY9706001.1 hypothetical protein [Paenibacillus alvei]MCY9736711.1 hypothetical protein [Paenibacillus alvei]MCY9755587.1 hypothetical protein [Paenibacillus alvei]
MVEKLFELGLGFIWHIIKGELPLTIIGSTLLLGVLFVCVGEWSERRKQERLVQTEPKPLRSKRTFIKDAIIVMAATFVVVGSAYGIFRLIARALPHWGWPVLPDGNVTLAWISLIVVMLSLAGILILELFWGDKPVTLAPFWIAFGFVWAALSTCVLQWVYPIASAKSWVYFISGLISALLCVLLRYLQQMDEEPGKNKEEGSSITVNK